MGNSPPSKTIYQVQLFVVDTTDITLLNLGKVRKTGSIDNLSQLHSRRKANQTEWFDIGDISVAPTFTISEVKEILRASVDPDAGATWPPKTSNQFDVILKKSRGGHGMNIYSTLAQNNITHGSTLFVEKVQITHEPENANVPDVPVIPLDTIELGDDEPLGRGAFGEVKKGKWNHADVAVKIFANGSGISSNMDEIKALAQLRHPRILNLMAICCSPDNRDFAIVTELMSKGSLFDILHVPVANPSRTTTKIRESVVTKLKVAFDFAQGMAFLHARSVVHRDLKSPNILISEDGRAKVADFGLSKFKAAGSSLVGNVGEIAGSLPWMAPEFLLVNGAGTGMEQQRAGNKQDVYGFGVVLWELFTLSVPWLNHTPAQIIANVNAGSSPLAVPSVSPTFPRELSELMLACLSRDKDQRPEFSDIQERIGNLLPQVTIRYMEERNRPFICPIGYEVMVDPVICADGNTYERDNIDAWLQDHDTSPLTNEPLAHKNLVPNINLRHAIENFHREPNNPNQQQDVKVQNEPTCTIS